MGWEELFHDNRGGRRDNDDDDKEEEEEEEIPSLLVVLLGDGGLFDGEHHGRTNGLLTFRRRVE